MKMIDRIIFLAIAVFLGILAARAFMPAPVRAAREEIIKVNLIRIGDRPVTWRDFQGLGK